jgi:hypothetical protein
MQRDAECGMTLPTTPDTETVRVTITITTEVHETFKRFAKAAGMSLSRAMGEWLADTVEAAEFTAQKMEQARAAPKIVMREMHAYAQGLADETGTLMETIRRKGSEARAAAAAGSAVAPIPPHPPSSNTGGKPPSRGTGSRGAK